MDGLKGKKTAVLGLGMEGLSSAHFLQGKKAEVTILDQKEEKALEPILVAGAKKLNVKIQTGENAFQDLNSYDFVVRSPGIKLSDLKLEPSKVTSQTKLFLDLSPAKIIGVTGTKGKGTTSSLIYEMLKEEQKDLPAGRQGAYLGGNIGLPPLEFLEKLTPQSWVVLELSSFQLQDITRSPHIAVVLMVTSEHLAPDKWGGTKNYHEDVGEYIDAKRNIVRFQSASDFAVISKDYPASNESDVFTEGKILRVSRERETVEGCFVKDGKIVVRVEKMLNQVQHDTSESGQTSRSQDIKEIEIIDVKDILLPGEHNLENVCAAVMAATLAGVKKEAIVSVLKSFKGLEHRLELVKEVHGVKYYDDSFSTTPETAIAAIKAFTEPEILVLGGSSKGADFSELGKIISETSNIKAIIGIGEEWENIRSKIKDQKSNILLVEGAKDMKQIVAAASKIAKPGDVVLMSPACASFDMFKNYKQRGDLFKEEVKKLQ